MSEPSSSKKRSAEDDASAPPADAAPSSSTAPPLASTDQPEKKKRKKDKDKDKDKTKEKKKDKKDKKDKDKSKDKDKVPGVPLTEKELEKERKKKEKKDRKKAEKKKEKEAAKAAKGKGKEDGAKASSTMTTKETPEVSSAAALALIGLAGVASPVSSTVTPAPAPSAPAVVATEAPAPVVESQEEESMDVDPVPIAIPIPGQRAPTAQTPTPTLSLPAPSTSTYNAAIAPPPPAPAVESQPPPPAAAQPVASTSTAPPAGADLYTQHYYAFQEPENFVPTAPMPHWAIGHDPNVLLTTKWLNAAQLTELCKATGMAYKRGKFSTLEQDALHEALEHYKAQRNLNDDELRDVIFAKGKKARDENSTFWMELATKVQGRPVIACYHYVRRIYHPMAKQGAWTKEMDDRLRAAVALLGPQWERVEDAIGRMAGDCRDRYRNHIEHKEGRRKGAWTAAEEQELTNLVMEAREKIATGSEDNDTDIFWGEIAAKMDHRRSRQQCRTKWQEQLEKKESAGEKAKWCKNDAFILVRKIVSLNAMDESEIEWRLLPDEDWHNWPGHILKKRYLKLKKDVEGSENMPYVELINILSEQYAVPPAPTAEQLAEGEYGEYPEPQYDDSGNLIEAPSYEYPPVASGPGSTYADVHPAAAPVEPAVDAYGNPIGAFVQDEPASEYDLANAQIQRDLAEQLRGLQ